MYYANDVSNLHLMLYNSILKHVSFKNMQISRQLKYGWSIVEHVAIIEKSIS